MRPSRRSNAAQKAGRCSAGAERFTAPLVVNAAGAWADEVAALAGLTRVGLQPRRRTAVLVDPPPGMDVSRWPFVNDVEEQFYFKPEAGSLFLSPADETPVEPSDAQPDEWDIAAAVERVEAATTLADHAPQSPLGGAAHLCARSHPRGGVLGEVPAFSGWPARVATASRRRPRSRAPRRHSSSDCPARRRDWWLESCCRRSASAPEAPCRHARRRE